ncbi:MAG: hypothetical protein KDK99_20335 [Verrucomicrobiales bacterium]|nr:hypothetical protein [Verrucomicrobiales bacterium]
MRGKKLAVLLLLGFGLLKLPMERAVSARLNQAELLSPFASLELRENLDQTAFAAVLGGLRSLVASVTYMRAYIAFEDGFWAEVDRLYALTTRLQPRNVAYWDEAAWQMAFNAASHYLHDKGTREYTRGALYQQYIDRGIEILREGLRYNPDSPRLWGALGDIYARRKREPLPAAEAYLKAEADGGPAYYQRLAAYQLLQAPDRESWVKAYELLRATYDAGKKFPSVIDGLHELERRLKIPPDQRIPEKASEKKAPSVGPMAP